MSFKVEIEVVSADQSDKILRMLEKNIAVLGNAVISVQEIMDIPADDDDEEYIDPDAFDFCSNCSLHTDYCTCD